MKDQKSKVTAQEWRRMHPDKDRVYSTDLFYIRIANKVLDRLNDFIELDYINNKEAKRIALVTTAYFEDVISQLGLWKAFVSKHKEMYGKWLPFYDTSEDYYTDEINPQDISFLVWIIMIESKRGSLVNPENPLLNYIALNIFAILWDEFEETPINELLLRDIYEPEVFDDFMYVKSLLLWLIERSYLLSSSQITIADIKNIEKDLEPVLSKLNGTDGDIIHYTALSIGALTLHYGPLALTGAEWLAAMCKASGNSKFARYFKDGIEVRSYNAYYINKVSDKQLVYVESLEREKLKLNYNSFNTKSSKFLQPSVVFLAPLAKYRGVWNLLGSAMFYNIDSFKTKEDFFKPNNKPSKVSHTDAMPISEELVKKLLKTSRNNRLFFFDSLNDFTEWFTTNLDIKELQFSKEQKKMFENGVMAFINSSDQLQLSNAIDCIKTPRNKKYNKNTASASALSLLCNRDSLEADCLRYLLDKGYLSSAALNSNSGVRHGRKLLQDNIRFLARFMRQEDI